MTSAAKSGSPPKRKRGRPERLTPDIMARWLTLARAGIARRRAALTCGVSSSTYHRTEQLAESADAPEHLRQFWEELKQAEAEAIVRLHMIARESIEKSKDPDAAIKMLKMLAPETYSEKRVVEMSGPGGAPIASDVHHSGFVGTAVFLPPEESEEESNERAEFERWKAQRARAELPGDVVPVPRALPEPSPSAAEQLAAPVRRAPAPPPEPARATHPDPMAEVFDRLHREDDPAGTGTSW